MTKPPSPLAVLVEQLGGVRAVALTADVDKVSVYNWIAGRTYPNAISLIMLDDMAAERGHTLDIMNTLREQERWIQKYDTDN